jgi:hypothetical protein
MLLWTLSIVFAPVLLVGVFLVGFAGFTLWGVDGGPGLFSRGEEGPGFSSDARSQPFPSMNGMAPRPESAPVNLSDFSNQTGQVFQFEVRGSTRGAIYGTDVYTTDSTLAMAAVHAGVLKDGQIGVVTVMILPGQGGYVGSQRNGVSSSSWSSYGSSYRFETGKTSRAGDEAVDTTPRPNPGTLSGYGNAGGPPLYFEVVGSVNGTVWGTDTYTNDSELAAATVHAGVLKPGQKGTVKVTMLPGQESYHGSTRNGVTTASYGNWGTSFRVEAAR